MNEPLQTYSENLSRISVVSINRPELSTDGFLILSKSDFMKKGTSSLIKKDLAALQESYSNLCLDNYMRDGGLYRYRRFARFTIDSMTKEIHALPHGPFFQSISINTLNGGVPRTFEPLENKIESNAALHHLIQVLFQKVPNRYEHHRWKVFTHQIRIKGIGSQVGKPTPEGIHQDGHHYVGMIMMGRNNVTGGLSRIYSSDQIPIYNYRLSSPLDALLVNDQRVFHDVTIIEPKDLSKPATRDMLLIDFNPLLDSENLAGRQ
jgi:hypothetical protein